jgi:alkylhydroperoxidase family enzyme
VEATGDKQWVVAVLSDWRTASVSEKLRAALGFLEKLTLAPESVGPADIAPLRAAGLNDRAIEEALYVCFLYSMIDRLADVFDFYVPTPEEFARHGRVLYRLGYWMGSVPG